MQLKQYMTAASALALAACSVGPNYAPPATPSAAAGSFIRANSPAVQPLAPIRGDWWRLYKDPVLDGLIQDALGHNTDVRAAVARLARARASLREVKVDRLPEVGANAGATRGREPGQTDASTSFDAGLDVAYEVDLFGRVSRNVEAARGDLAAAAADAEAVRVAIVAETARAYADAASAAERIAVAERIVALLDQSLNLTERRRQVGLVTGLDTARIAGLRDQRRADVPALAAQRQAALFRLATLTGRTPSELPPEAGMRQATLRLDRPIPVGDGAALLARRPDVRAAERRLAASTARLGVATADLYPRITLGASIGSTGPDLGGIFTGGPLRWAAGSLLRRAFPNQVPGGA